MKNYQNLYAINALAKSDKQKAQEREKARYFHNRLRIADDYQFRWSGPCYGSERNLMHTLKSSLLTFADRIPSAFCHNDWVRFGKESWRTEVDFL